MSRRFKTGTMRFGVPLSVPASLHVERCYGMHGKGYAGCPPRSSDLDLVLVNAERTLRTVDGFYPEHHKFLTDAVGLGGDGWKILGWRMSDGSCRWASTTRSIQSWRNSTTFLRPTRPRCLSAAFCRTLRHRMVARRAVETRR